MKLLIQQEFYQELLNKTLKNIFHIVECGEISGRRIIAWSNEQKVRRHSAYLWLALV